MDLFDVASAASKKKNSPLAERMKPACLEDFVGQKHIVGEGKLLKRLIEIDRISTLILFGPPGSGKTALAKIIANTTSAEFLTLNAVTSGVKDIREAILTADNNIKLYQKKTVLFIDEIHRFNKSQQDALLPYVEDGTVTLVGATTENPYYEINNALISRSTVLRLEALEKEDIKSIIIRAVKDKEHGLGMLNINIDDEAMDYLSYMAGGDARKALNALEIAALTTKPKGEVIYIALDDVKNSMQESGFIYDKNGDSHYDIASALIKSMRGSDPDAALQYLARMLTGGEKPEFVARRLMIFAGEDVGNADPNAINIAVSASIAVERVGMPEARIILAQAVTYLSSAPKSNASYIGINKAMEDVRMGNYGPVPIYLRDGVSGSKASRHDSEYRQKLEQLSYKYPHNYEGGYVEQDYLSDKLPKPCYYEPKESGYEKEIAERLRNLGKLKKEV